MAAKHFREERVKAQENTESMEIMAQLRLLFESAMTWPFKLLRARKEKAPETAPLPPPVSPAPGPPPAKTPETAAPIKLSHLQEADLTDSLRAKATRVLKDLSLDSPAANTAAVVGGRKRTPPQGSLIPPENPTRGPII
jgi:ABC-type uncharacterized transport system involved in gliding motility auxiliary subunit